MTKRDWVKTSTVAVMLSTSLLMFADGGQAFAAVNTGNLASQAYDLLDKPYKSNAHGPSSFDSAGFVSYVLKQSGINVADSISGLKKAGTKVSKNNIQVGDVLFLKSNTYVGIYVGDDTFLQASKSKGKVVEQSLSKVQSDLVEVRRMTAADSHDDTGIKPGQKPNESATAIGQKVIKAGEKYLGTPYKYASSRSDKSTMDCSEFVMWAFKEGAGIDLGKGGARSEFKKTTEISRSDLRVGDLVFFSTKATMKYAKNSLNRIGHVGIYAGNNKVLHTYGAGGVKYSDMSKGWWNDHFERAGRVIQ